MGNREDLAVEAGLGLAGGLVATRAVMEPVQQWMNELEPEDLRRQEQVVSSTPANVVAAEKILKLLGYAPTDEQRQALGTALHYATGISWGPLYLLLRRGLGLSPILAGIGTGLIVFAIMDLVVVPTFGFSKPLGAYPPVTHVKGLIAHLAYGLGIAASVEAAYGLWKKL